MEAGLVRDVFFEGELLMTESHKKKTENVMSFKEINPELYRHPGEKDAWGKLEKAPGFAMLIDLMSDHGGGKAERLVELASMVKVGPDVYPKLFKKWQDCLEQAGLAEISLHICGCDGQPWTLKGGNAAPRALLSSSLLDELSVEEMQVLLAMIAGSVKLGNATNIAAAEFLRWVQDFSGIVGTPAFMLSWAFENWRRYAAMSADRAACLQLGADHVNVLLRRISGAGSKAWGGVVDEDRLRLQGLEAASRDKDWDKSRWQRFASTLNRHNSGGLIRILDLSEWVASGAPEKILAGIVKTPEDLEMEEGCATSGLAFWGEFAAGQSGAEESGWRETATEIRDAAEKGVTAFFKAGEAFFNTLRDNYK